MSEAIPLDNAGRMSLKTGDVVRTVNDPNYQFLVTREPYGNLMKWLIDLQETTHDDCGTPHYLIAVTHLIRREDVK